MNHDVKLADYPATVLNERMYILGVKHTLTLLHIFRGSGPPTPP